MGKSSIRWRTVATATATACLGIALGVEAQQQGEPNAPPVLQIGVETIRAGRGSAHTALEQRWAATYKRAGVGVYWIGATTVTGPNEFWWFTGLSSVAELEAQDKAVQDSPGLSAASDLLSQADADNVEGTRDMLARFRPDLSRLGGAPVAQARYFEVIIWRVRPGQDAKFEEAAKLYKTVVTEANANSAHWATYQIISGMQGPTYLVFVPMKSLGEMDPGPDMAAMEKAMNPARQKQFNDLAAAGYISVTNMILQFQPRMSNAPPDMAAMDPSFWNVRP